MNILIYPDSRLRIKAESVEKVDEGIRLLIDNMLPTMYAANGVGLAATQVDVHKRVLVVDVSENHDEPYVFVNPVIEFSEGKQELREGCLSVPGFYGTLERAAHIRVAALDRDGNPFKLEAEGLLAVCIQHECDHMDGRMFVDHLSSLKRRRIRKKLHKQLWSGGRGG